VTQEKESILFSWLPH